MPPGGLFHPPCNICFMGQDLLLKETGIKFPSLLGELHPHLDIIQIQIVSRSDLDLSQNLNICSLMQGPMILDVGVWKSQITPAIREEHNIYFSKMIILQRNDHIH